jgi:NAD(P)H-hydrate repair Nnr-like enzyme with NAD(P)H-hydrate dehydratase domain
MATAGSGDVLSGILTGIMGFAPDDELLLSTASGAYINGLCGMMAQDAYTSVGMTSSDTAGFIPHILKSFGV